MENLSLQEIISILKPAIGARMLTQEQKDAYEQGLSILEGASIATATLKSTLHHHLLPTSDVWAALPKRSRQPMPNFRSRKLWKRRSSPSSLI